MQWLRVKKLGLQGRAPVSEYRERTPLASSVRLVVNAPLVTRGQTDVRRLVTAGQPEPPATKAEMNLHGSGNSQNIVGELFP